MATFHKAFATVLRDPEVLARFKSFGSRPMMTDSKEFGDFIASEIKKWTAVVAGVQPAAEVILKIRRANLKSTG